MSKNYILTIPKPGNQMFFHTIGDKKYRLVITYNRSQDYYTMSLNIIENNTEKNLIGTIPLVCGVNLFQQYEHLGLGSFYIYPKEPEKYGNPTGKTLSDDYFYFHWRH